MSANTTSAAVTTAAPSEIPLPTTRVPPPTSSAVPPPSPSPSPSPSPAPSPSQEPSPLPLPSPPPPQTTSARPISSQSQPRPTTTSSEDDDESSTSTTADSNPDTFTTTERLLRTTTTTAPFSLPTTRTITTSIDPSNNGTNNNGTNQPSWASSNVGTITGIVFGALLAIAGLMLLRGCFKRRRRNGEIDEIVNKFERRDTHLTLVQTMRTPAPREQSIVADSVAELPNGNSNEQINPLPAVPAEVNIYDHQYYHQLSNQQQLNQQQLSQQQAAYYAQQHAYYQQHQQDALYQQQQHDLYQQQANAYYQQHGYPIDPAALQQMQMQQSMYYAAMNVAASGTVVTADSYGASGAGSQQPVDSSAPEKHVSGLFTGLNVSSSNVAEEASTTGYIEKGRPESGSLPIKIAYRDTDSPPATPVKDANVQVSEWSIDQVCAWFTQNQFGGAETVASIREQEIDGRALLLMPAKEFASVLKVEDAAMRERLEVAVSRLKRL
ncbi:hypothetical protein BJ741DRAFT_246003 [Chytriomyces cf. hyalinus JEL632]|nr:hypothetical protein BJ741DRAFT_246003 [Chytriomyces cf. hyalinus JEL632]